MEARTTRRRLIALGIGAFVALALAAGSSLALQPQAAHDAGVDYGYVYSGVKSSSVEFVRAAMDDESLLVLGSSEFSTPARLVPEVPSEVFGANPYGLHLMLVGEAYDQCLWHTMALGALADGGLPGGKAVLIVAPGQFVDGGVEASVFNERFSYTLCRAFFQNAAIPSHVKDRVATRLLEQGVDEAVVNSCTGQLPQDLLNAASFSYADDLRLRKDLASVRSAGVSFAQGEPKAPDWDYWYEKALADAALHSTNNDWGLEDGFYSQQLQPALDRLEGARAGETYSDTPEYDDLACLLEVAQACDIQVMVVVCPVCGPYYDHIGIRQDTRQMCYERIRDVVERGGGLLADYSSYEYEPYFLYDIVHFGWVGWVDVQKAIFEFARGA